MDLANLSLVTLIYLLPCNLNFNLTAFFQKKKFVVSFFVCKKC